LRQVCTNCTPYGDLDLSPEKDATAEVGFEAVLMKINSKTAFQEEAIGFDLMTYKYFNVNGKTKPKVRMF
jgi:vitamin B12 transporter